MANTIEDRILVKEYYLAYLKTCANLVDMKHIHGLQDKNVHEYFVKSITAYMTNSNTYDKKAFTKDKINELVFALTSTNTMMPLEHYATPDPKYEFNIIYTSEQHINIKMHWEFMEENIVYTHFLNKIINKWAPMYASTYGNLEYVKDSDTHSLLTDPHRDYDTYVSRSSLLADGMKGGNGESSSGSGNKIKYDCVEGMYLYNETTRTKTFINFYTITRKIYDEIKVNSLLMIIPYTGGHKSDFYYTKYLKYKKKYIELKKI